MMFPSPDPDKTPIPTEAASSPEIELLPPRPPEIGFLTPVPSEVPVTPVVSSHEPPPGPPQPGFWLALGLMVLFFLVQVILMIPGIMLMLASGPGLDMSQLVLLNTVVSVLSALILSAIFLRREFARGLAIRGLHPWHLAIVLASAFPLLVVNYASSDWCMSLLAEAPAEAAQAYESATEEAPEAVGEDSQLDPGQGLFDQMNTMYAQMAAASWPVVLLFFCLFPALGEEIFFRGLLGRGLVARFGVGGLLLTSFLFGLSHLDPARVVATAMLGAALHLAYLATRSLLAPVLLHFVNNLLAFGSLKLKDQAGDDPLGISRFDSEAPSLMLATAAVAALAALGWMLFQTRTEWLLPDGSRWRPGYATPEMPPASMSAKPRVRWPSPFVLLAAFAALAVFGWLFVGRY